MFPSFLRFVVYCHFPSSTKQIAALTPRFVSIIVDCCSQEGSPPNQDPARPQPRWKRGPSLVSRPTRRPHSGSSSLVGTPSAGFAPGLCYRCAEKEPNIPRVRFFLEHRDVVSPSADSRQPLSLRCAPRSTCRSDLLTVHTAPAGAPPQTAVWTALGCCPAKPSCGCCRTRDHPAHAMS